MNTIENDSLAESAIWHERMLQGCQEVIRRLTIVLLRLKQKELMAIDKSSPLSLFVEFTE